MVETNGNSKRHRRRKTQAIIAVILVMVAVVAVVRYRAVLTAYETLEKGSQCQISLIGIAKAMIVYANDDPNDRLPTADKWCDLLAGLDSAPSVRPYPFHRGVDLQRQFQFGVTGARILG